MLTPPLWTLIDPEPHTCDRTHLFRHGRPRDSYLCQVLSPQPLTVPEPYTCAYPASLDTNGPRISYLCQGPGPASHTVPRYTSLDNERRSTPYLCLALPPWTKTQILYLLSGFSRASSDTGSTRASFLCCPSPPPLNMTPGFVPVPGPAPPQTNRLRVSYLCLDMLPLTVTAPEPPTCASPWLLGHRPSGSYLGLTDLLNLSSKTHLHLPFTPSLLVPHLHAPSELHAHLPSTYHIPTTGRANRPVGEE